MNAQAQAPGSAAARHELTLEVAAADFDAFFTVEYPRLVVLLTAATGHRPVAEDLAQEALVRVHQRWSRVSRYDRPGAWVRRVALNLAANSRARSRSERRAFDRLAGQRPPPEARRATTPTATPSGPRCAACPNGRRRR